MIRTHNLALGLVLYMAIMAGAIQGANVGYQATAVEDTEIAYNGSAVQIGENVTQLNTSINSTERQRTQPDWMNEYIEPISVETPFDDEVRHGVNSFAESLIHATFTIAYGVADKVATMAFYMSPFVPQWVVGGVLQVLGYVPFAVVGIGGLLRLGKVVR